MPFITRLPALTGADPYPDALLALDFVGARRGPQYYKALGVTTADVSKIPGWTYTGGTPAGTGSYAARQDGSLQFFPSYTNLLLQSQTFDSATWTKLAATVTANATTAPDGTATADKLEDTATTNSHGIAIASYGTYGANTYTGSVYVKAAEYGFAFIWMDSGAGDGVTGQINLSTGAATVTRGAGGTWSAPSVSSSNAGNGWWRVSITATTTLTSVQTRVYQSPTAFTTGSYGTPSYTGTTGSGIYIWGAQLELGSTASTYIPTTTAAVTVGTPRITDAGYWAEEARTNLQIRSQEFDNTGAWSTVRSAVTANQTTAPDGTTTADKLDETATTGTHYVAGALTVTTATVYTYTVYLKAGERTYAAIYEGAKGQGKFFNLSTGAVMGNLVAAPDSAAITSAGNGWWRCSITITTAGTSFAPSIYTTNDGSTISYAGTAGSGIYTWQADVQAGSFATSPIPTTSVAVTRAADVGYVSGLVVPSAYTLMSQGTVSAQTSGFPQMFALDSGAVTDQSLIYFNSSALYGQVNVGGVAQALLALGAASNSTTYSAAMRVAANDFAAVRTAGTVATDAAGSVPTTTILRAGRGAGGSDWNGPIRRIVIYPRAFGNSELQAITTAGAY